MRELTEKEIHITSRLLYVFDITSRNYPDWDGDRVKEYIDVGEWGLAAGLADFFYLPGKFALTITILNIFVDLADRMRMLQKDSYRSIRLLLENPPEIPQKPKDGQYLREPNEDEIHIKSRLLYLYDLTSQDHPDWEDDFINEYIHAYPVDADRH